jgi:hypothetical protein
MAKKSATPYLGKIKTGQAKKSPQTIRCGLNPIHSELEETGVTIYFPSSTVCFISAISDIRFIYNMKKVTAFLAYSGAWVDARDLPGFFDSGFFYFGQIM